jgi:hypothetical protein
MFYRFLGSWDETVRIWDIARDYRSIRTLEGHADWVRSVIFSPDGKRVTSGGNDYTVRIWDCERDYSCIKTLEGHTSDVNSIAFSPDGNWLVTGSKDHAVRAWEIRQNGDELQIQLHWTSRALLFCKRANIEGALGLSPDNKALLEQYETIGTPSDSTEPCLLMDYPEFIGEKTKSVFLEMYAYFIRKKLGNQTRYQIKLDDFSEILLLLRDSVQDAKLREYAQEHGFRHVNPFQHNNYQNFRARIIKLSRSERQGDFDKYIAYLQQVYHHLQALSPDSIKGNLSTELEISTQVLNKLEMLPLQEQSEQAKEDRTKLQTLALSP